MFAQVKAPILLGFVLIRKLAQEFALSNDAAADIHCFKLLEQQFVGVRNFNRGEVRGISTSFTTPDTLFLVCNGKEPAIAARETAEQV